MLYPGLLTLLISSGNAQVGETAAKLFRRHRPTTPKHIPEDFFRVARLADPFQRMPSLFRGATGLTRPNQPVRRLLSAGYCDGCRTHTI